MTLEELLATREYHIPLEEDNVQWVRIGSVIINNLKIDG